MGSIVLLVDRVHSAHCAQAVYDPRKVGGLDALFLLCCLRKEADGLPSVLQPVNAQLHERTKKIDMDHSTVFGDPKITPAVRESVVVHRLGELLHPSVMHMIWRWTEMRCCLDRPSSRLHR